MKTFRIGISEEESGYITVTAKTKKEAEKIADEILNNDGIRGFNNEKYNYDVQYRECHILK